MQNSQGSVMNTLYRIADGSAEAMEFTASANTRHLGVPLKDLQLRKGILIAVLARGRGHHHSGGLLQHPGREIQ